MNTVHITVRFLALICLLLLFGRNETAAQPPVPGENLGDDPDTNLAYLRGYYEGYTQSPSVKAGDHVEFAVSSLDGYVSDGNTTSVNCAMKIYRVHGTSLAQDSLMTSTEVLFSTTFYPLRDRNNGAIWPSHHGPTKPRDYRTGCGWPTAVTYPYTSGWPSGFYYAKIYKQGFESTNVGYIPFVVRAAISGSSSDILCVIPWNTYQAYNYWGGGALYWWMGTFDSPDYKQSGENIIKTVSFRRPFVNFPGPWVTTQFGQLDLRERSFIAWAENNNYPMEYCVDGDLNSTNQQSLISSYATAIFPGHSEYWSRGERTNVETNFKASQGGNLSFYAPNNCYWMVDLFPDNNSTTNPDHMFCEKDGNSYFWRKQSEHGEAKFIGIQYEGGNSLDDKVPGCPCGSDKVNTVKLADHWIFNGTGVQNGDPLGLGSTSIPPLAAGESDMVVSVEGMSPSNVQVLAEVFIRDLIPDTNVDAHYHDYGVVTELYSDVAYHEDVSSNSRVFASGGSGWDGCLYGNDATIIRTMTENILDHFSLKKFIGTIYPLLVAWAKPIELDGDVQVLAGNTLQLINSMALIIDNGAVLYINGTVEASGDVTIAGGGNLNIDPTGQLVIKENSTLTISPSAYLVLENGGDIVFESGSKLILYAATVENGASLSVDSGGTLEVQAGGAVSMGTQSKLLVYGKISAIGSSSQRITFTSNKQTPAPGDWGWIACTGGGPDTLTYCDIRYAQTGINFTNTLANCYMEGDTIANSSGYGVSVGSTGAANTALRLYQCGISNNQGGGIEVENAKVVISSTRIENNGTSTIDPGIAIFSGGKVYLDGSRIQNNLGSGIDVSDYGSRVSLSPDEINPGYNTLYQHGLDEIYVHNSATAFLGTTVWFSGCECIDPDWVGQKAPPRIMTGCPPGCMSFSYSEPRGGWNNVSNDYTYTGRLINNGTSSTVSAQYTYWGTHRTNEFVGPVDHTNELGSSVFTPAKMVFVNPGIELSGVSPDREKVKKWLRQLKHDVEDNGINAADAMYELALYTGAGGEYQEALDIPWASFVSHMEASALTGGIKTLATVLRLQDMMDRGDFIAASDFTDRVLHRNGIDDDLWMICQTKGVIAAVGIGDPVKARALFEGMRERASQINGRATQALERYIATASNVVPGQGGGQGPFVKTLTFSATAQVFSLDQNYPNPFNPLTTITYTLPEAHSAILKIYNVLGQEVATIVNEFQEAGKQRTSFNSSSLPSGLYFYKLVAGKFSDVKKMMLLK